MDADYEFKQRCSEAVEEVWEEAIDRIKDGTGNRYIDDRLTEAADGAVPIYTNELYKLVEYLDEYWDDVHTDSKTLDDALRYACFMKASDYCSEAYIERGGERRLDELEEVWGNYKASMDACDLVTCQEIEKEFPGELAELKVPTKISQALKPKLAPK